MSGFSVPVVMRSGLRSTKVSSVSLCKSTVTLIQACSGIPLIAASQLGGGAQLGTAHSPAVHYHIFSATSRNRTG